MLEMYLFVPDHTSLVLMAAAITIRRQCGTKFIQAVKIMEHLQLHVVPVFTFPPYFFDCVFWKLCSFGGGDSDVLVVEQLMPIRIDAGVGANVLHLVLGEGLVVETIGRLVEAQDAGEGGGYDVDRDGWSRGDKLCAEAGLV